MTAGSVEARRLQKVSEGDRDVDLVQLGVDRAEGGPPEVGVRAERAGGCGPQTNAMSNMPHGSESLTRVPNFTPKLPIMPM